VARVEETARLLRQNGAAVTLRIFDDRDHRVCDEEIAAASQMLRAWGPAAPRRADGIATN
jgi:predicted esterase